MARKAQPVRRANQALPDRKARKDLLAPKVPLGPKA
jgi:hypothetical protein